MCVCGGVIRCDINCVPFFRQVHSFFHFYMTLAIDILDGFGFSSTACGECYQDDLGNVALATEVTHNTSNKNGDFSYKCECVNT